MVSKEEITKVNGIEGIFRVQPVIIIPPLKDSRTQERESQGEQQEQNQKFSKVLIEVCNQKAENLDYGTGNYNRNAREVSYLYESSKCFDFRQ